MAFQLVCLFIAILSTLTTYGAAVRKVPAIYAFGDSTIDVGNNNYLLGIEEKADYHHYGIDLTQFLKPTGRFSNGYIGIDYLAMHLGFKKSPPPYLSIIDRTHHGLRGVNFASAGSGVLDSTGDTITMTKQIQHFKEFKSNLTTLIDTRIVDLRLSKSIFFISTGGNDIFAFLNKTSANKTESEFIGNLSSNYVKHIKVLYGLGARKFGLINEGPVGCCPFARTLTPSGACSDTLNGLSRGYNRAVQDLIGKLSSTELPKLKYSIGNTYELVSTIMADGKTEFKYACCGSGALNAQTRCNPNTTYCADRDNYLFWDMLHPSQATGEKVGIAFYNGSLQFASPINIKQLAEES